MENKIKITSFENGIVIKISGELDSSKVKEYRDSIHYYMRTLGPSYLVWDFSCLTFLDSSGVGLILGRYNEIERINGKMGLVGLNSYSRKILGISGLFSLMREYRSTKEFISEERIYLWLMKWNWSLKQLLLMNF